MKTPAEVYSLHDLRNWATITDSLPYPIRFAVLGDPVAHSASPQMHNAALKALGIKAFYTRLHIRPHELPEALQVIPSLGFLGVNLTIPHKTNAIPLLHHISPQAKQFGAVNTVKIQDFSLHGSNTDGEGLSRAILSDFQIPLSKQNVLILGAGGGAGRTIAIQCALAGCPSITLANRSIDKLYSLASEIQAAASQPHTSIQITDMSSDALAQYSPKATLIIQCSSLGMQATDPSPFPKHLLSRQHAIYDTIYSRRTQLLTDAASIGAQYSNGLSMLLHQGAIALETWLPNSTAPVDVMKAALLSATQHIN